LSLVFRAQQVGGFVARFQQIRGNHALSLLVDSLLHEQASHFVPDVRRLLFDVIKPSAPNGKTVRSIDRESHFASDLSQLSSDFGRHIVLSTRHVRHPCQTQLRGRKKRAAFHSGIDRT
jgi:hypothetical protein